MSGNYLSASRRGFTLIELVISCALIFIITISLISLGNRAINNFYCTTFSKKVFCLLNYARAKAIALDQDIVCEYSDNQLVLTNQDQVFSTLTVPQNIKVNMAKPIGFKGNGNTKYSNKIVINAGNLTKEISVVPSIGKVTLK